ncbi:MAG TPA: hypothetical protein VNF73_01105 [Candidatus Saccharimonadales bacterium]|nr:hypothetical protein [Candidatus Saccharimonadales bacterium]
MRLFLGGLRKLPPRPATWVTIGLLLGLILLVFLAVGGTAGQANVRGGEARLGLVTFPGAYRYIFSFVLGFGGLLALIYGAAIAGSEWTWGTLKSAVARGEGRARYVVLTFAATAVLIGVGLLLAFGVGVIAAFAGAHLASISTAGISDGAMIGRLPADLAKLWLGLAVDGALGYAIATLARSQLGGIGAGIAIYFGSQFGGLFLPDVVKYLPFSAASAMLGSDLAGGGGNGPGFSPLDPTSALVVVVAWLIGALIVAAAFTERAEIGG